MRIVELCGLGLAVFLVAGALSAGEDEFMAMRGDGQARVNTFNPPDRSVWTAARFDATPGAGKSCVISVPAKPASAVPYLAWKNACAAPSARTGTPQAEKSCAGFGLVAPYAAPSAPTGKGYLELLAGSLAGG